jgi:ArsR family transcriptional regulator, arsenate/arsenite/antimonite-responsive transcriptional repressor
MPASSIVFKALADPTRREILRFVRRGEMTAGDLAARFEMTKPTMSHHFAVLKEADLLTSRREGQTIWYGLNTLVIQNLMAWAMDLLDGNAKARDGGGNEQAL